MLPSVPKFIWRALAGLSVPIPTLPSVVILNFSVPSGKNLNIPLLPVSNISAYELPSIILSALNPVKFAPLP